MEELWQELKLVHEVYMKTASNTKQRDGICELRQRFSYWHTKSVGYWEFVHDGYCSVFSIQADTPEDALRAGVAKFKELIQEELTA